MPAYEANIDAALELVGNCCDTDDDGFCYFNAMKDIYPLEYYMQCVPDQFKPVLQTLTRSYATEGGTTEGITPFRFHLLVRCIVRDVDPAFKYMCTYNRNDNEIVKCERIAVAAKQWWMEQSAKQMQPRDDVLGTNNSQLTL